MLKSMPGLGPGARLGGEVATSALGLVWGLGFGVWGLGFGFRVWGLGFRVWGLGFRI